MKTPIELLKETLDSQIKLGTKMVVNWDMYLEKEKEVIMNAYASGEHQQGFEQEAEQYYNETFNIKEK